MKLITPHQTFLPTDLFPEYTWSVSLLTWGIYLAIAGIFFAAPAIGILGDPPKGKLKWVRFPVFGTWILLGATSFVFLLAGITHYSDYTDSLKETRSAREANLVQNIQTKYNVEEVDLGDKPSVSPSAEHTIEVKQGGVSRKVTVTQDPVTYEPTLAELIEIRTK